MRNIYLYILLFITLVFGVFVKAQDNSIAGSVLTPVANQTGVPDISFPIVELPATRDFTISLGLTYNPNAYRMGEYSGQVARNWALTGSNFMITRKVMSTWIDEGVSNNDYWDDIYYYTLNGEQGSFKFKRTGSINNYTYQLIKLTPSNLKIEFEREIVGYIFQPVKSFTITDSKGYKYYFQDHDYQKVPNDQGKDMRNTFYITKILDSKNRQVVTYTNKKYTKYDEHNPSQPEAWTYLPEKIQTDYGSILIGHGDNGYLFDFQDRYFLNTFTLKDHKNNFVSKYVLDSNEAPYQFYDLFSEYDEFPETRTLWARFLSGIKKLDKNSNVLEKTSFGYDLNPNHTYGPSPYWWHSFLAYGGIYRDDDPNSLKYGLLESILLPTGAKIEYEFKVNKLKSSDKNTPEYIQRMQDPFDFSDPDIQYLEHILEIEFDTHNATKYYITGLEHSPNSRVYIRFIRNEIYPWDTGFDPEDGGGSGGTGGPTGPPPKLVYTVKNAINNTSSFGEIEDMYTDYYYYVVPSNGAAYIELLGSGGNGVIDIYEKKFTLPPYVNENTLPNSGVRVEKIKYYSRKANFSPGYPQYDLAKTIEFDYSRFDEPGISSGIAVADDQKEAIIYKNVKMKESDKGGYTKYYYDTPYDYPPYYDSGDQIWPHYNLVKKGILKKQEIYNEAGNKVHSTDFNYTLPEYDSNNAYKYEIQCDNCDSGNSPGDPFAINTQEQFAEKIKTDDYEYDAQGNSLKVTVERGFNLVNNNLMWEKKTSADGSITETAYKYAQEKNNTKLLNANMISVPLEVSQKKNGTELSKVEMKFDHTGNYFPSNIRKYGIGGVVNAEEKNDLYDTMGNVLQTTTKTGIPTTYIYGYNSTLLIAKVEGATYAQVMSAFGLGSDAEAYKSLEIYAKSNLDVNDATEETLRLKLDEFRLKTQFKDYFITTYTYDPLIGIRSLTTASGNKEYYFYDNANRLVRVEDINHHIIKENKYETYVFD